MSASRPSRTRIHTLEQQLGCTLFVRNKAGTTLTPAGRQFQRHASALVRTVEQARHDVGIPRGFLEPVVSAAASDYGRNICCDGCR